MSATSAAKGVLGLGLFVGGLIVGVLAYRDTQATPVYGPYPPLPEAAEPRAADDLTDLIIAGNDRAIAERYDTQTISGLADAFTIGTQSLVTINDIRYLGTVADGRQAIAMYAALGTLQDGRNVIAGFSLRIADGEVVGVN